MLLVVSLPLSAQEADTTKVFLDEFENFVESVEANDSTINWEECNAQYKAYRTEFKDFHKDLATDGQYLRYNKLKARYVKLVSKKKVGKNIRSKVSSISSAVRGTVEGALDK